jgi:hypothetical protein
VRGRHPSAGDPQAKDPKAKDPEAKDSDSGSEKCLAEIGCYVRCAGHAILGVTSKGCRHESRRESNQIDSYDRG